MILPSLPKRFALLIAVSATFTLMAHAGPGSVENATKFAGNAAVADGDQFGSAVANLGDLDGDGVDDIAVGAVWDDSGGDDRGAVHILFFNANGTVKANTRIADGNPGGLPVDTLADYDEFGSSLTGLGDLDGDGVPDLAVGADGDYTGGTVRGAVYILFLNANGTVKTFAKIADGNPGGLPTNTLAYGDYFGRSVSRLGDLDGDGIPELAVGAWLDDTGGRERGAAYILFLNANGTVKSNTKIADDDTGNLLPMNTLENGDGFGGSISDVGDLDGDSVPDLAVGAEDGGGGKGALHIVFLNANGTVKGTVEIADDTNGLPMGSLSNDDRFGGSVTSLGDLDGDSIPDLAVGAWHDDTGGGNRGAVHVLFLNADGTVKDHHKIADNNGLPMDTLKNGDLFGYAVTSFGDLDGDGLPNLAVGAIYDDTGGSARGAVHLLEIGDLPFTVTTADDEFDTPSNDWGSTGLSLREAIRDADDANSGEFRTINFAPGLNGDTITLTMGELAITDQALKITGKGLADGITISGNDVSRVFNIDATSEVVLECLGISDGKTTGGGVANRGGGILNAGTLSLKAVTVSDNDSGANGGGVQNTGILYVSDSSFVNNTSTSIGGAIGNQDPTAVASVINSTFFGNTGSGGGAVNNTTGGTITLKHVTITGNSAPTGGGIRRVSGTFTIENSIISGNTAPTDPDMSGTINEFGTNLIGVPANLAALGDYGGKTLTMPPLPGSPAIDMATFIPLPTTDQRGAGFARVVGAGTDIGAAESGLAPPPATDAVSPANSALQTSLNSKIKKLKKKIKTAKKKGQKAKAKKLTTKLKKLLKKLKAL